MNQKVNIDPKAEKQIFFVAGATGTVGYQIAEQLLLGGHTVRALTRDPNNASLPQGAEPVAGDLRSPKDFMHTLEGTTGFHLITFTGKEYTPLDNGEEIIAQAARAGVKRVTVLWDGEGKNNSVENAVRNSTLEWTILRPQEYMANVLTWTDAIRQEGLVREPFGDRPTAAIHERDIGAVAAHILTYGGYKGKSVVLTGPEVLTPRKQVDILSKVLGRTIRFEELSEAEARSRWKSLGFSYELVEYLFNWYRHPPLEGRTVVDTVERITGNPGRRFVQWAKEHLESFR